MDFWHQGCVLLDTLGSMERTDLPANRLPELAALADTARNREIVRVVIQRPLIKPAKNRYGSVQIPDVEAIRAMAATVLPPPGTPAKVWPGSADESIASGGVSAVEDTSVGDTAAP